MSRVRRSPDGPRVSIADDATLTRPLPVIGIVRTSKGYAVATAEFDAAGVMQSVSIGISQSDKRFIAQECKRKQAIAAVAA